MKRKLIIGTLLLAILSSLAAGCGQQNASPAGSGNASPESGTSASAASQKEDYPAVTLRVGWPGTGVWSGVQGLTYQKGFFDEELAKVNAKIEVTGFSGAGPEINAALTGKSLDAGIYGDVPSVQVKSKGTDTTLLGGYISNAPTVLVVKPEINSVKDLKGKKIATGFGTYAHRTLGSFLATGGLSLPKTDGSGSKDVEFLNLNSTQSIAAYTQGQIDGFAWGELDARQLKEGSYKILLTSKGHPEWGYGENIIFRTEFVKESPQVAIAFLKAILRGQEYAKEHTDELRKILVDNGKSAEIVDAIYPTADSWNLSLKATPEFLENLKATSKFLVDQGLAKKEVDVDQWYDGSLFEEAEKEYAAEKNK